MSIPLARAPLLEGKRGLIVGIANDQSIAWGCAKAFRALGAELAVTYLNDKAKKFVEPLAMKRLHMVTPASADTIVIERVIETSPPPTSVVAQR